MECIDENGLPILTEEYQEYINNNVNLPVEVYSTAEMNSKLNANNVGKVYIYRGITDTYINGNIYIVEEVI